MRRREFITLLGGTAAAWPLGARAQQSGPTRRIGVLMAYGEADRDGQARFQAFRQGLGDLGWAEGRNIRIDDRWAGVDISRMQTYARELVSLAPDVILATSTNTTQAARDATRTIPIVFVTLSDPVGSGVISNLARPEGNLTGFTSFEYSLAGKWLSLLRDMAPHVANVAFLFNPDTAPFAPLYLRAAEAAAERLALKITATGVRDAAGIERVIAAIAGGANGGLVVLPDAFNNNNSTVIIALAATYRVPAIYTTRLFVSAGGLMSYATDAIVQFRTCASYVDRILRGAKSSELPVQFPTKFDLVINLKTAKELGLDVSQSLQFLADEVIE